MKSKTERTEIVRIAEDQTITKKRYNHLTNPGVLVSLLVFIFGIGATRGTLNSRIKRLEEFKAEVNIIDIQRDLQEIKANVAWLTKLMSDYIK